MPWHLNATEASSLPFSLVAYVNQNNIKKEMAPRTQSKSIFVKHVTRRCKFGDVSKYVVCVCTGGLAAAPMNANVCHSFDYILHESCKRETVPHYQWQGECVSTYLTASDDSHVSSITG